MPTTTEITEAKAWLATQGLSVTIISRPAERVQWYRGDGTPLPKLLPCDPYHLRAFRAKGWTLTPGPKLSEESAVSNLVATKNLGLTIPAPSSIWERVKEALKGNAPMTIKELGLVMPDVKGASLRAILSQHRNKCQVTLTAAGQRWALKEVQV